MKTKIIFLLILISSIFIISCSKEEKVYIKKNPKAIYQKNGSPSVVTTLYCDWMNPPFKIEDGCCCVYPAKDCCPVVVIIGTKSSIYQAFKEAVEDHEESSFFASGGNWDQIFPELDSTYLLTQIQNGDVHFLLSTGKQNVNPNQELYLAVPSEIDYTNIESTDDVICAFPFDFE